MSVLVGKTAPDFSAAAVINGGELVSGFTLSQFQGNDIVQLKVMLHALGFDHLKLTYRFQGRDFRLTDVHGNVVKQLLA